MATYGGSAIFGASVTMATTDNPRVQQQNHFFGLSGVESLDGGLRGRFTEARGVLYGFGASPSVASANLAVAEESFRGLNDGLARVLVDTRGVTWIHVKLEGFQPQGRILKELRGSTWYCIHPYQARFIHLV